MNHRPSSLAALFLTVLLCFPHRDAIGQADRKPILAGDAEVVALSADGTRLVVADDDLVRVIDTRDESTLLEVAEGERQVFGLALRADGARLAIIRTKNRPYWVLELAHARPFFSDKKVEPQIKPAPRETGTLGSGGIYPHELRKHSLGDSIRVIYSKQPLYFTSGNPPPPPPFSCRIEI